MPHIPVVSRLFIYILTTLLWSSSITPIYSQCQTHPPIHTHLHWRGTKTSSHCPSKCPPATTSHARYLFSDVASAPKTASHLRTLKMASWAKPTRNSPILFPKAEREVSTSTSIISKYVPPPPIPDHKVVTKRKKRKEKKTNISIRITPTKPHLPKRSGNELDENVSNTLLAQELHRLAIYCGVELRISIDHWLTIFNSPRASNLHFLRPAYWPSPGSNVRSEFVHTCAVWSFHSLVGYQSGSAQCSRSSQYSGIRGWAQSYPTRDLAWWSDSVGFGDF